MIKIVTQFLVFSILTSFIVSYNNTGYVPISEKKLIESVVNNNSSLCQSAKMSEFTVNKTNKISLPNGSDVYIIEADFVCYTFAEKVGPSSSDRVGVALSKVKFYVAKIDGDWKVVDHDANYLSRQASFYLR